MTTTTPTAVSRTSRAMAGLTLGIAVLLPATVLAYWLFASRAGLTRQVQLPSASILVLDFRHRLIGAGITLIPVAVLCSGLLRLRQFFLGVARGAAFAAPTMAALRDFGLGLMGMGVLSIPVRSLLNLIMSGGRQLNVAVGLHTLLLLGVAGVIALAGRMLQEAAGAQETPPAEDAIKPT